MKKFYKAVLVVIMVLTLTGTFASAQGPVGADCTDPPNLVPFADLVNCDLSGMDLEGINIWSADLTGANLSDSNLSDALLEGVDFTNANATGAIFDNADLFTTILIDATFDNASLRDTNMEDAYAIDGSFINADLRGANLYFANFRDANVSGANFSGNYFHSFDLPGAIAQNANFSGARMTFMNMRDTDLRGADLSGTALGYVSFHNADFRDATLLGAERSSGVYFDNVIWGNTTCADGSNSDDDDGDNFTCEGNFPENLPPTITLTSPADGASVPFGETITISADAADPDGSIIRVAFYADDGLLGYDVAAPYSFDWTNVSAGPHEIYAIATDDNGVFAGEGATTQSATVTITVEANQNNQPPSVTITKPKNNQVVYRLWGTDFRVNASDSDGVITKVEFYVNGVLVYTDTVASYGFYWFPSSRGTQTLTAKAYDDSGSVTTSTPVTVRVR